MTFFQVCPGRSAPSSPPFRPGWNEAQHDHPRLPSLLQPDHSIQRVRLFPVLQRSTSRLILSRIHPNPPRLPAHAEERLHRAELPDLRQERYAAFRASPDRRLATRFDATFSSRPLRHVGPVSTSTGYDIANDQHVASKVTVLAKIQKTIRL